MKPDKIQIESYRRLMHLSSSIPWGGTPGKGGDFVKDLAEVCNFPLLNGDKE